MASSECGIALGRLTVLTQLSVNENGLNESEVNEKRKISGWNELIERRTSFLKLFFKQFQDVMIYILLIAALISLLLPFFESGALAREDLVNATVIVAVILANAVFGFTQEIRAENAIALLRKLTAPQAKVRREGKIKIIPSRDIVPGDLVLVEAGDRMSADGRVVASSSLEADEASLTGESIPVAKIADLNTKSEFGSPGMLYAGTLITRGYGEVLVTATGLETEIGKISSMVSELETPATPLQIQLKKAGKTIGMVVLFLCGLIFVLGLFRGLPASDMFFTAVTLAVAAVPEGLPAIVTICLALGVQRMIKKNALIRRMDAIETLGNVTVICADKTGTITENKMQVKKLWVLERGNENRALVVAASCNRAELPDIGDPTEIALIEEAEAKKIGRLPIHDEEVPFTSEAKYMVTVHDRDGKKIRFMKGAPEVVAGFTEPELKLKILAEAESLSMQGFRVIAVAEGFNEKMSFGGLIALMDSPRKDLQISLRKAEFAGIRTIMITGDHPATALAVASAVGIRTDRVITGAELEKMSVDDLQAALKTSSVFARVKPVHKVKILKALQETGEIVAMTGDGVNDAPALKSAHVGVAMGRSGTDIARGSAAMILTDDNYSTIVEAVAEGRKIYDNIKKSVQFLFRSNMGEIAIIAVSILAGMPIALLPLHILWINLVTDSLPALALANEEGERDIMLRTPRRRDGGIFGGQWPILFLTVVINVCVTIGIFVYSMNILDAGLETARTMALTATIVFQLSVAYSIHSNQPVLTGLFRTNIMLVAAIMISLLLHLGLLLSPLSGLFNVTPLSLKHWILIFAVNIPAFLILEAAKIPAISKRGCPG
ncbi:hypothetical protein A3A67_05695 [Candidatus Peribacteria bacterium RIFCSPLOWO2_01_FULL_51_18]|nr:MAG: hypothetical protein A3A67_05695 [Candidatus Peribacteria bacterium RIFCSPLOWO2_01_FULL_51_18]